MKPTDSDITQRFIFTEMDIRGEVAQLHDSYSEILANHHYPPAVANLLGEFLVAACLMAATLKFEGKLSLQARSDSELGLIMAECTHNRDVRAVAQSYEQASSQEFSQLLSGGTLVITIDPKQGQRYQGLVPLEGINLADCLQDYFERSEQLHTRFWLSVYNGKCAGMMLQQLPSTGHSSEDLQAHWQHVCQMADTIKPVELFDLPPEELVYRLYHQDQHELFPPQPVNYRCSCSRDRCLVALQTVPPEELEEILAEDDMLVMDCQFCGKEYRFKPADISPVDNPGSGPVLH